MKELLVPVGSMDSLKAAVMNGADAIYLGGKKFGARARAVNFNDEEMEEAIKFAHLYGVKIYVTVNTLIYESELESVYEYCKFLHNIGVDALIVQDIGLMNLLHNCLPNLEIHASTQVHNICGSGLKILEDLNVKRVVFARELSLEEIKNIKTDMEKEIFIHGALCISYSGECLFSSMLLNRSGNRGECAQVCRLPYKIKENNEFVTTNGEYLLSTKELNTVSKFKEIMESDVKSLKIEGRMKDSTYVACVTRMYRNLIDYYYGKDTLKIDGYMYDIEVIFNRKYTTGFLFNATNENLMNIETSNHVGIKIGKVINKDRKYIYMKLSEPLNQEDGIRIKETNDGMIVNYLYDKKGKLVSSSNDIAIIDNKINASIGDSVYKTSDILLKKKYEILPNRKVDIDVFVKASLNEVYIKITDRENEVSESKNIASKAINAPITKETILKQINKLGNTPFNLKNIDITLEDNIFINIKDLNELRRELIEKLITLRENKKKQVIEKEYISKKEFDYNNKINYSILVRNEEQLKCALTFFDRIYVDEKNLYLKYKDNDKVYFRSSRVFSKIDYQNVLSTELGSLYLNHGIADYYLNITNHETINYLSKYSKLLTLSVELSDEEISNIMNYYDNKANLEMVVYSRIELMITKYCPVNFLTNKDKVCTRCHHNEYKFVDRNNEEYPILTDKDKHLTHILDYKITNKLLNLKYYFDLGIRNFRIELTNETEKNINELINSIKKSNI